MSSAGIQEEDHWYHGSITREIAEERLREHGKSKVQFNMT